MEEKSIREKFHHLRSLMATIHTYVEISQDWAKDAELRQFARVVKESVLQTEKTIEEISDEVRGSFKPVRRVV